MKTENLSKGKVQNMINQGAFKQELTVRNVMSVEEFLEVEVGCGIGSNGLGVTPCTGLILPEEDFYYKGIEYYGIHLTFKNEVVLIGKNGGLKVKWKSTLGSVNTRHEEFGRSYDTKNSKLVTRRIIADKEGPFDAVILDLHESKQGDYFTHTIKIVKQHIADVNIKNGTLNKRDAKYITMIEPILMEELIEEYGSWEIAQEILSDLAPELDKTLFEIYGNPCEQCKGC